MKLVAIFLMVICVNESVKALDTLSLPEITILEKQHILHALGRNISETDTVFKIFSDHSLNALIESAGIGILKNYGAGNSSIFSNQGTAAQHNQVVWNGIACNNALLGSSDISLLTSGELNDIKIIQGTTSSYWGGGAIGSTLLLRTLFDDRYLISVGMAYQSLGNQRLSVSISKNLGKYAVYSKISAGRGENKFTVLNYTDPKKTERTFSAPYDERQVEFSTQRSFNKSRIQAHIMYADMARQLSNSLTEAETDARQGDRISRGVLQYDWSLAKMRITSLAGYTFDRIIYKAAPVHDTGLVHAVFLKSEIKYNFKFGQLYAILQNKYEAASNSSFKNKVSRNTASVIAGFTTRLAKNLSSNVEVRVEKQGGNKTIAVASASIESSYRGIDLKTYVSGSYNNPTLNDLNWVPGGNIHLKPEKGINAGVTISKKWYISPIENKTTLEGFYHNIQDWIQWVPQGSIWSPVNFKHVISSGVVFDQQSLLQTGSSHFILNIKGTYTHAVNISKLPEANYNKQLAYIPGLTGMFSLSYISGSKLSLRAELLSVGERYTVFDQSASLPSYAIVNLYAGKKIVLKKTELLPYLQVNNLLNKYYESVAFRPREPLHFLIGFKINIL